MTGALVDIPRGTMVVATPGDTYIVREIASGIATLAYDASTNTAGIFYASLPASPGSAPGDAGRYANTGIREFLEKLSAMGVTPDNLKVALIGGAESIIGSSDKFESLASRTLKAISQGLSNHGVQGVFEQTGGFLGRTVLFDSSSGDVFIKDFRDKEEVVCNLRGNE